MNRLVKLVTAELCPWRKSLVCLTIYSVQNKVKRLYVCFSFTSKFIFGHHSFCRKQKKKSFVIKNVFKHFLKSPTPRPGRNLPHKEFMVQDAGRRKTDQRVDGNFCTKLTIKLQIKKGTEEGSGMVLHPSPIVHPFSLLLSLLPYFIYIVGNLFVHWWIQACLDVFVKLVGQAQQKPEGPLAMDSNCVCYLHSNTSRQVQQIRGE